MPSWPSQLECLHRNCTWEETNNTISKADPSPPPLNYYSIPLLTAITVACTLLFLIGVAGNVMTILVVSKYRDMRTTTNLYLCSMAVSDLLIFLCMPLDLYRMWRYRPWRFGDALCKLFQFVSESSTYSTILSITALSVERYLAICFPLRAKALVTKRRVRALICLLWTVSLLSAGPVFVMVGVEQDTMGPLNFSSWMNETNLFLETEDTRECKMTHYAVQSGLMGAMVWLSSVFFFMPVFCLTVLYSLIGRRLWQRHRETNMSNRVSHRDKSNRQTIKMLVVVVLAFVLCWLPFHVGRYLQFRSLDAPSPLLSLLSEYCSLVSVVLFYLSAAINPILYNTMSWKYRGAAARLFGLTDSLPPRGRTASTVKGDGSNGWTESTISF
uniref:Growth hormone secretagogue receptor type 1 n=3 Tax=Oreochromis TaxID=8139 RepID=A0A097HUE1_ORENI|nr:growth hormone secretagogue receptor [Oreochromis niloticus]BAF80118.1 growth hormone secretagogue receptor 1a [Oreochromis mossambicus]BAF80120.1 growth hormone secretagogue receptor 1a [Oreochromis mossambicus]